MTNNPRTRPGSPASFDKVRNLAYYVKFRLAQWVKLCSCASTQGCDAEIGAADFTLTHYDTLRHRALVSPESDTVTKGIACEAETLWPGSEIDRATRSAQVWHRVS